MGKHRKTSEKEFRRFLYTLARKRYKRRLRQERRNYECQRERLKSITFLRKLMDFIRNRYFNRQ